MVNTAGEKIAEFAGWLLLRCLEPVLDIVEYRLVSELSVACIIAKLCVFGEFELFFVMRHNGMRW